MVPKPNQPVMLRFNWPERGKVRTVKIRLQTDLDGPWRAIRVRPSNGPPAEADIGSFDRPTPVSYRVDASLDDGRSVELWGYFTVGPAE